jgi:histidinol-phosphate aminotransferase
MFNLDELLRPHIKALKPYASARDEYEGSDGIFLDANENPYGSVTTDKYNRYPDPHQRALKKKIAKIKNVNADQIFLGNGSDEAIDLIYRLFCTPGKDNAVILPPTYGMYEVSAELNEVKLKKVSLTEDFQIDTDAVLAAIDTNTKVIWFCSPNNPTANDVDPEAIKTVLEKFKGIVVVDEAYIDFTDLPSFTTFLDTYPNLVVLQTFSKAWGLAGLRLGMAFASKEIIHYLDKIKAPYNINLLTQTLVAEGISNTTWKDNVVKRTLKSKEKLAERLEELPGLKKIYPSSANFLLVKIEKAKELYDFLVNNKIIVRDRSSVKLCEDCLRISVGTEEENEALVEAIKKYK